MFISIFFEIHPVKCSELRYASQLYQCISRTSDSNNFIDEIDFNQDTEVRILGEKNFRQSIIFFDKFG